MADTVQEEDKKSEPVQEANEASVKVEVKCDSIFVDALKFIDCIYKGVRIVLKWFIRVLGLIFRLVIGYPLVLLFVITSSIFIASWVWLKNCYCKFVGKPYNMGDVKDIKTHITKDVTVEPTEENKEEVNE